MRPCKHLQVNGRRVFGSGGGGGRVGEEGGGAGKRAYSSSFI